MLPGGSFVMGEYVILFREERSYHVEEYWNWNFGDPSDHFYILVGGNSWIQPSSHKKAAPPEKAMSSSGGFFVYGGNVVKYSNANSLDYIGGDWRRCCCLLDFK